MDEVPAIWSCDDWKAIALIMFATDIAKEGEYPSCFKLLLGKLFVDAAKAKEFYDCVVHEPVQSYEMWLEMVAHDASDFQVEENALQHGHIKDEYQFHITLYSNY